ncbi:TPA: MFS transporter [Staphylococcus pseudintermedius]
MRKNYRLIMMFTIVSLLGSELFVFSLSFKLLYSYDSSMYYSIFLILYSLIHIIFNPLVGCIIDKYKKLTLILISQLLTIFSTSIYFYVPNSLDNLYSIYLILTILTIADLTVTLVFDTSLIHLVGENLIESTVSNRSAIAKMIAIVSPMIAGIIYALIPLKSFLLILFCTEIIALLTALFINYPKNNSDNRSSSSDICLNKGFQSSTNYLWFHKDILLLVLLGVFINFQLSFLNVGIPSSFTQYFHMSASNLGIMQIATPLGMILIAIIYPMIKLKSSVWEKNAHGLLIMFFSILLITLTFVFTFNNFMILVVFVISRLLLGVGVQYTNIPSIVYLQKNIPDKIKGIFFGFLNSTVQSIAPVGFLLAGILFSINNIFFIILFSISGIISLFLALYALRLKNKF